MAAAVLSTITPAAYCNRIEQFSRGTLLRMGLDGQGLTPTAAETALGITAGSIAQQALQLALDGYVSFNFTMGADTNTAGVVNLTTLGVDFLTVGCVRRVEVRHFIAADVDTGAKQIDYVVACAATPIVGLINVIADNDVLPGDLAASTAVLSVSTADVILTLTGITDIDTNWVVEVRIYPKTTLALEATT